MGRRFYLYQLRPALLCADLQRRIKHVNLQQVVVPDVDFSVLHKALNFLNDRVQVEALKNIVHMEPISAHLLNQIRCAVTVVSDFQRVDLLLLD